MSVAMAYQHMIDIFATAVRSVEQGVTFEVWVVGILAIET